MSIQKKLAWYFELMGIKFRETRDGFMLYYPVGNKEVDIEVKISEDWVEFKWTGPNMSTIKMKSPDLYVVLLETMLKLNNIIKEVKIGVDDDENIVILIHSHRDALFFDVFESEFMAIPIAIQTIMEIEPLKRMVSK